MNDRQRNRLRAAHQQIGNDLAAIAVYMESIRVKTRPRAAFREIRNDLSAIAVYMESIRLQLIATDRAFAPDRDDPDRTTTA